MEENVVGYLKYEGRLVEEGILDTRKAAQALIGFDEILRFYITKQIPKASDVDFEMPVYIKKGSWIIQILENVGLLAGAGAGIFGTAYLATAGKKIAENDFEDVKLSDVIKKAFEAAQWVIRIGKHVKDITKKKFKEVKFKDNNSSIGIPNENNEYLYIPKEFFDLYIETSPKLLEKAALLVERERFLTIGVIKDQQEITETITYASRRIFTQEEDDDEVLFPELKHGMMVELEGELTRGNETSNTVGFKYQNHILTCEPESGSIVRFKNALFLWCKMHGRICRTDKAGGFNALRPRIIFNHIQPIEAENSNYDLFGHE